MHPNVLAAAVEAIARSGGESAGRLLGLQADTSRLRPEGLDGRDTLDTADLEALGRDVLAAQRRCGLRVLGGPCGTDDRHIRRLAEVWAGASAG